jgi:hypothetical protein
MWSTDATAAVPGSEPQQQYSPPEATPQACSRPGDNNCINAIMAEVFLCEVYAARPNLGSTIKRPNQQQTQL